MSRLIDEYRRSLKLPRAEETADLFFYRPLAFGLVKLIYRLPVTPNQVTIGSLVAGLIAAWEFGLGSAGALRVGAAWYMAANILDCADGQLARMQGSGSPLGRLVDGIVDYISTVAVFVGIGIALTGSWWLVVAAGLSSAVHAIRFDQMQGEFISAAKRERSFVAKEQDRQATEVRSAGGVRKFVLNLYASYLNVQERWSGARGLAGSDPETYERLNFNMIRGWTLLGPTTNRTLLMVCAVFGRLDWFLWAILIPGNVWLIVCTLMQKTIDARMAAEPGKAE